MIDKQVPLVPVWADLMLQPASFLSQYLPSSVDGYIPAAYARQVISVPQILTSFEILIMPYDPP